MRATHRRSGVCSDSMRPEARILGGLALIATGAAGLIAMNIWTVPTIGRQGPVQHTGRAQVPALLPSATDPTPAPIRSAISDAGAAPSDAAIEAVDAAVDAAAVSDASTSRSTDGTVFPSVRFEAQSRALSKEMIRDIEPIAEYLRNHFGMKVVLVGHGDGGMDAAEYVRVGRFRAAAVLRMFVDYGVSVARIGIELPKTEGDKLVAQGVAPGTVEVRIEPRFQQPKKGEGDVP